MRLDAQGAGVFRHAFVASDSPGYVEVEVVATGTVGGLLIERNDNVAFTIYPDSFRPVAQNPYSERLTREGLFIDAQIAITRGVSGEFRVTGVLLDQAGNEIVSTTTTAETGANPGPSLTVPLFFAGSDLLRSGQDGPYRLGRVLVVDHRDNALVSADERNPDFSTSAFSAADVFGREWLFLPLVVR